MIRSPGPQRIFAAHAVGHHRGFRVTPRKRPTRTRLSKKPSARRRSIAVINPATGELLARHPIASAGQVRAAVEKARVAFRSWSRLAPTDRAAYLSHLAEILRKHRDDYARTMTLEMGKVIREANAEVDKCAWAADVFAKEGPRFLDPEPVETEAMKAYIAFDPRGVLGSIMPWNFPMWQIVRFAVPALMAGNTAVVKPASASPQSALNLEEAFREAGFPDGTFQVVVGDRSTASALIDSPISLVSLTGSVGTGVQVAQQAAEHLKKAILELGGSDPFIVADDPDLDAAVREANDSEFGLGASLWTQDLKRAEGLVRQIDSGMVFVNGVVKSDPRMPFGGIKHSGIGRELSRYGLLEMVNIKTVQVFPAKGPSQTAQPVE